MLIPFGVLSAAGAGGSDYELIETNILGSAQAEVVFSSLATYASTYKHLQIRMVARTNRAGDDGENVGVRLNADTGSNYADHVLVGNGSSVQSAAGTSQTRMVLAVVTATTATANAFGVSVIDILDSYSTTKNKTLRALAGLQATSSRVYLMSGLWMNTASITSATLLPLSGGSFIAGSRFSLYGIRG